MSNIHYWTSAATAGVGFALGLAASNFALQAEPGVELPSSGRSLSIAGDRKGKVLIGASITGVLAAIVGLLFGWSIPTPTLVICSALAVALAIVDLRCRRLPYAMLLMLYVATGVPFAMAALTNNDAGQAVRATVSAAVGTTAILVLALALPGQLGLGDMVLFGWVVFSLAWFGWRAIEIGVLGGLIGQAIAGLVFLARHGPGYKLPYGPALLAGWFVGVVMGAG